jgi:hypothetical protein
MRKTANKGWQITVPTYAAAAVTLEQHPLPCHKDAKRTHKNAAAVQQLTQGHACHGGQSAPSLRCSHIEPQSSYPAAVSMAVMIAKNSTHKHGPDHFLADPLEQKPLCNSRWTANPFPASQVSLLLKSQSRQHTMATQPLTRTVLYDVHAYTFHPYNPSPVWLRPAGELRCSTAKQLIVDPWLCLISAVKCGIYPKCFMQQSMKRTSQPLRKTTQTYASFLQEKPHNNAASEYCGMHTRIRVYEDPSW